MSDRHDPTVLDLLERADTLAPTMSVEPDAVIAAGRRKVRRRRGSAAGVGALALAGALWLGTPLNPLAPTDAPAPASISWQEGVDAVLFDNGPHPSEQGRTHWTGQLRSGVGDAFPTLVLTRNGEQLEPVDAQDGPGEVMTFHVEGLTVAAWKSPAGSLGEQPLWSDGVYAGQGGSIQVDGSELQYAAAEFVPGASAELEELYWFTEDEGHAASGAAVDSAVLTAGESSAVVMVDEAREVWGTMPLDQTVGLTHVERLVLGTGLSGWVGQAVVATSVGVLPPGASSPSVGPGTADLVQATVGSRTAVLASDPSMDMAPVIRFSIDGRERTLESYVQDDVRTLSVAGVDLLVTATPDAIELWRGEKWGIIGVQDLAEGRAVVVPVLGGHLVVVPGWEPEAEAEGLRVLVGTGDDERWVEAAAEAVYLGTLFDGRSLVVLGLDEGVLANDEAVLGVGEADGDAVDQHELPGGITEQDLGL